MDIQKILDEYSKDGFVTLEDLSLFLESNNWFNVHLKERGGQVFVNDDDVEILKAELETFVYGEHGFKALLQSLGTRFPETTKKLIQFMERNRLEEDVVFSTADFLLYRLNKEIFKYTNKEAKELVTQAAIDLEKGPGDCLTFFMTWLRDKRLTLYTTDFTMEKRYTLNENGAYNLDDYLQIFYVLFNEGMIEENDMWRRAAESQNYTDTWMYLSINCLCALRQTDLERIYHPFLPCEPQEVINKILDNTFTDNEARETLLSITEQMKVLPLTPNKTRRIPGVDWIKFEIPSSCEVMMGRLFALAEAHRQLNGTPDMPIIRKISTYKEIRKYMGDEVGDIFLREDFRARSATKSYLQMIFTHADDALADEPSDGIMIRGYIAASLARSHKGSYGEYAASTYEYLKDAKLSGYTPEFIAFQLLERGVLSFAASMLLSMITNREYENLSPQQQTSLIKALDLRPNDIDNILAVADRTMEQAKLVVRETLETGEDVLTILSRIASGQAVSKTQCAYCLKTAMMQKCPYPDRTNCLVCEYEISTKATLYLMAKEYNRLYLLYKNSTGALRNKYKDLIAKVVLPKLNETLTCIKNQYGNEAFLDFESLLKENLCSS